jgi:hypothetical protein
MSPFQKMNNEVEDTRRKEIKRGRKSNTQKRTEEEVLWTASQFH